MVSLAWERIRTYPAHRPGSVAANVLWDVRKRHLEHRAIEDPRSLGEEPTVEEGVPSAEEIVMGRVVIDDLVAAQQRGLIHRCRPLTDPARARVEQVSLDVAASEQRATVQQANCIRWRAQFPSTGTGA